MSQCKGKRTALIFICTGKDYWKFLSPAIEGAKKFIPAEILLFTDNPEQFDVARQIRIRHAGWPDVTLSRYHTILTQKEWLSGFDYIFYLDVDMRIVRPLGDEILADGLVVTVHSSFIGTPGTPETDPRSTACVNPANIKHYVTGCFVGGACQAFLALAETISRNVDIDRDSGFIAKWHDESHLNRYIVDHPPARVLPGEFASWIDDERARIVRVRKETPDRPAVNGTQPLDPRNCATPVGRMFALLITQAQPMRLARKFRALLQVVR